MIAIPDALSDWIELLPGRKLTRGRYGKHVTSLPSKKNGSYVMCETLLEADLCLELERSAAVSSYVSQPFTLKFKNSKKHYTPDFAVKLFDGTVVIYEVKSDAALRDTPTFDRLILLQETFATLGHSLEIIKESQFRHPIKTSNLQLLYQKSYRENGEASKLIIDFLHKSSSRNLVVGDLLDAGFTAPCIAHSVFYSKILCDLFSPFTLNSHLGVKNYG
ncbi:hypothetical protein ACNFBT_11735 [Pseudomonas sp. NY15181]|uniref:hypothetical protein n=1 Tax=Pseudomonas sp. NY15181 TaxID=3400349 RepID=UPI003A881875